MNQDFNNTNMNNMPNNGINEYVVSTNPNPDEEYLKAYVGKNYDEIKQEKFNFFAFFITGPYLFYRKKYLWGFLYMLIGTIINLIVSNASLGLSVLVGVFFNKFYIKDCRKAVEKIKNEGIGVDPQTIITTCVNKGGTSLAAAILLSVGIFLLLLAAIFGFVFLLLFPIINQTVNISFDETAKIKNIFSFENTMNFNDISEDYMYAYDYSDDNEEEDTCLVYLYKMDKYNTVEDVIKNNAEGKYKTNPIKKTVNDIEWTGYVNSNLITEYNIFVTEIDDELYMLEYDIYGLTGDGPCHDYKDNILENVSKNKYVIPDKFEDIYEFDDLYNNIIPTQSDDTIF